MIDIKELKNSREIFTVVEFNIRIHGNIFQIYIVLYHGKILHLSTLFDAINWY
jgi:hypothetical protein